MSKLSKDLVGSRVFKWEIKFVVKNYDPLLLCIIGDFSLANKVDYLTGDRDSRFVLTGDRDSRLVIFVSLLPPINLDFYEVKTFLLDSTDYLNTESVIVIVILWQSSLFYFENLFASALNFFLYF